MLNRIQMDSLESRQHFAFGAPIAGFGVNGQTTATLTTTSSVVETTLLPGGAILAGTSTALVKFSASGTQDSNFGVNGKITIGSYVYQDHAVDSAGRIYLLTRSGSGTIVLRYTASGQLDSGFGTGGTALVETSKAFRAKTIDIASDGKIVVAGTVHSEEDSDVTRIYRLTAGGTADSSFSGDGKFDLTLGASNLLTLQTEDAVVDVRALSGGKIAVLGGSYAYQPDYSDDSTGQYFPAVYGASQAVIARIASNGTMDSSYGTGGFIRKGVYDGMAFHPTAGVLRADGTGVVSISNGITSSTNIFANTAVVGFSGGNKAAFTTFSDPINNTLNPIDATALADGRVAFINGNGSTWIVNTNGVISNVVKPKGFQSDQSTGIVASADGDLIGVQITYFSTPLLTLSKIDAGSAGDGRPDELENALGTDSVVDAAGNLHIAYFDAATKTLKYVYRNPQGLWSAAKTIDATAGAGANLSIDVRFGTNEPPSVAIAYYAASSADLKLATTLDQKKWGIQTLASKGAVGLSPNVLFTDAGFWAVTYYGKTTGTLYYALHNGKKWTYEVVDTGGSGAWNEFQFDPSTRRPAVAYSGPGNTVKYAFKNTTGWGNTVAIKTAAGAGFINLSLPQNVSYYGPVISYYDLSTADLVLLRYDRDAQAGKKWSATTVASRGIVGSYSELITSYSGDAKLYAWNRSSNSVSEYRINRYEQTGTSNLLVSGGGSFLSVAATDYFDSANTDLIYTDTASGKLFVR